MKVFFTALLADRCGHVFNDLELFSPAKIDADFSLYDFALAEIACRGSGMRWGLTPFKDVSIIQMGGLPEAFAALKSGRGASRCIHAAFIDGRETAGHG